jgi:hypothetical protein
MYRCCFISQGCYRPVPNISVLIAGIVESVDFLDPWSSKPEVVYARPLVEVGERVSAGMRITVKRRLDVSFSLL